MKTTEQLQAIINNSAAKQVHELSGDELLLFRDYAYYNSRLQQFKLKNLPVPEQLKMPIDDCVFPIGSKIWFNDDGFSDNSVFILKEFDLSVTTVRSSKYTETQEHSLARNLEIDKYAKLMEEGVEFPALLGYQDGNNVYISDGNRRFLAAKKAGLKKIKIFVEEVSSEGFAKNRKYFVQEALDNNIPVSKKIIDELQGLRNGKAIRITFSYAEKRRNEYPSIGDQLDAVLKALAGDTSELVKIRAKVNATKSKYPK